MCSLEVPSHQNLRTFGPFTEVEGHFEKKCQHGEKKEYLRVRKKAFDEKTFSTILKVFAAL